MNLSLSHLGRLAFADLLDEWPIAIAVTLAIAAVLAPLLVLSGLQSGVIGEIFYRLRTDPAMRRITLDATGASRFDDDWFRGMRERPDVSFVLPATRFAAAQLDVSKLDGGRPIRVSLVPTGESDPVFGAGTPFPEEVGQVGVSASVAASLGVVAGDRIAIDVERRRADGRVEAAGLDVTIVAVADPGKHRGTVVFARPELLTEIEAFRDGFRAPLLGNTEGTDTDERKVWPNFRLYARGIEDVGALALHLRKDHGLSVSAQEGRIDAAIELDRNIGAVLQAIILLGAAGLAGSLTAIMWASASRKRRTIAMLALIGYGRSWLIGFPVVQGLALAVSGSTTGLAFAFAAAFWINHYFAGSFGAAGAACTITMTAVLAGVAVVAVFSLLPSLLIGAMFNRLEPSDEIRDV